MKVLENAVTAPALTGEAPKARQGNDLFSPAIVRGDLDAPVSRNGHLSPLQQFNQLTPREREVLQLIAEGKINKEIASDLSISIKTVEKHRGNLMGKLGIHGIAGLTRCAIAAGLVECAVWPEPAKGCFSLS